MESILNCVKKMIGIAEDYDVFDVDIIVYINSVLSQLTQMGVGPPEGFRITGKNETWESYVQPGKTMELVKTYVPMKVRMMFDPPLSASVANAMSATLTEMEWRLHVDADA